MTIEQDKKFKKKIYNVVRKSGISIGTETIAGRVNVPEGMDLTAVLNELVAEGRLTKHPTLLVSGEVEISYNLVSTAHPAKPADN